MRRLIAKQLTGVQTYKGRPMRCTEGVHEEVAHLVTERVPGPERGRYAYSTSAQAQARLLSVFSILVLPE